MTLEPPGLFVMERLAPLTPPLFAELLDLGAPFTLTVDYRGLEPPLEELDRVRLAPADDTGLSRGTLVLRRTGHGFEFCRVARDRTHPRDGEGRVARVVSIERPGVSHDLDAFRWRLVGALLVGPRAFPALYGGGVKLARLARKLLAPFPCPLNLGSPDRLVRGVVEKYADPGEVVHQARLALDGLEPWEEKLFDRVIRPRSRVLVVGCGAGREAVALARRGLSVVAVDPVPALVAAARRLAAGHAAEIGFRVAAAHELDTSAGPFDAILCSSAVYQQTPTRRRRRELLQSFGRLLVPDGVIVLCVGWHPVRGPRLALVDALRWGLGRVLGEHFPTEPGDRLIRHLSLASDPNRPCFYHAFRSPDEIRGEIEAAGLAAAMDPDGPWIVRRRARQGDP